MDPSRGDSRYNINYSMSSIGLSLADQADLYCNPAAAAALGAGGGGGGGGGRPPSGGLLQSMGGGSRSGGGLMSNAGQCQSLNNTSGGQSRGIKRSSSDCYDDHHRGGNSGGSGMTSQSLQGLESCAGGNGTNAGGPPDVVDDSYASLQQSKKSPPANGKKTKGRVKIKMEYIDNKLRRYTTFSKRKTGIMKKAYELSTLTGTQVMLLVASETGHVYTFATRKLQPMITSEAGKQLIQTCLNSPDPPSVGGGGDQRMSATGFEETELSYNIADEDSKDDRSPMSSGNESDDSSDIDSPGPPAMNPNQSMLAEANSFKETVVKSTPQQRVEASGQQVPSTSAQMAGNPSPYYDNMKGAAMSAPSTSSQPAINNLVYQSSLANIPQEMLLSLVQSGHLQLHTEEDGSGHQYITIPISMPSTSQSTVGIQTINARQAPPGSGSINPVTTAATNMRHVAKDLSAKSHSNGRDNLNHSAQPQQGRKSGTSHLTRDIIRIKEEPIE